MLEEILTVRVKDLSDELHLRRLVRIVLGERQR